MAILVTVNIPNSIDKASQVEADNPDMMATIGGAAQKYMTGHRRFVSDGAIMDIDEYATAEDYDKFLAEAGDAVRKYGELLGARDTVWTQHAE